MGTNLLTYGTLSYAIASNKQKGKEDWVASKLPFTLTDGTCIL